MTVTPVSYSAHVRALFGLGLPLVGGHLAQFAIGMTDTIMLGWYGIEELAALTLASSWFFTIFLMGSGFAMAVTPLVASYQAKGDEQMVRRTTRMGLWLSILFFIAAIPLLWWSEPVFLFLGQNEGVSADAQVYLRVAGLGLLPALGVMVFKSYLAALERTQVIFWITVVAALGNAFGNYVLIFGNFGAPELGILGGALSSLITQMVSLIGVMIYALWQLPEHALFKRFWKPDSEVFSQVFRLGWPIGLTSLTEVGLFAGSAVMMGWLGTVVLAAHGIALQLASASFMIHLGISNAATVRAGSAHGRQDGEGLGRTTNVALMMSAVVALITTAVFLLWPEPLMGVFLDENEPELPAILAIGVSLLAMAGLFQLFDGLQAVALGVLRGVQDTRLPMLIGAFSYWGVGFTSCYVFGFVLNWGAVGVWFGLVLGLVASSVLLLWRFWGAVLPELKRQPLS